MIFIVCLVCGAAAHAIEALDTMVEHYFDQWVALHPILATRIGVRGQEANLAIDIAPAHRQKVMALHRKYLRLADRLAEQSLSYPEALTLTLFRRLQAERLRSFEFPQHLLPLNPHHGLHIDLAEFGSGLSGQPFSTVEDYRAFLKRARRFPAWVDQAIANFRQGMREGVTLPRALVEKVLPQIDAIADKPLRESVFWRPIATMPGDISATERKRLQNAYTVLITRKLQPAYRKLRRFLEQEYLPHARHTAGLAALPSGAAWYAFQIRWMTTTDMQPEALHALGLQEVERIHRDIVALENELGYSDDVKTFLREFRKDPKLYPFKSEQEIIAQFKRIEEQIAPQLERQFRLRPKALLAIRTTPAFRAASASAQYQRPSADGSRPGVFLFPVLDPTKYGSWGMEALFLHEGIPGHHYQIALQQETKLPRFRQFSLLPAYGEGWALYAESLGAELGVYRDPYQRLGRSLLELHRANRLVVDTGLHHYGWSRERAMRWLIDHEGSTEEAAANAIERYMAWPAQALAYKVGELKILELKRRAQAKLGANFDVRDFHDEVLKDGALPLSALEEKIERWLAARRPS